MKLKFGNVEENVVTREEFPLEKAREVLKNEVIAVIGYGVQGPGQALNLRDNGFNVIVGQRSGSKTWDKAIAGLIVLGLEEGFETDGRPLSKAERKRLRKLARMGRAA